MERWSDLLFIVAKPLLVLLLGLGVLLLIIKPFLKMLAESGIFRRKQGGSGAPASDATGETEEDLALKRFMSNRERMTKLAESEPGKASELVKKWIRDEDAKAKGQNGT